VRVSNSASFTDSATAAISVLTLGISITAPPGGTAYTASQTVTLQADASDGVSITKVEFYDGGTLRGTDTSAPYRFDWTFTGADNGLHAWTARAYDEAGNTQTSAVVSLIVGVGSPGLEVTRTGNNLTISWTSSDPSFVLQQTSRLGFDDAWTDVLVAPVVNGTAYTVTLPISGAGVQGITNDSGIDVTGASSPQTIDPAAFFQQQAQGFYRLRRSDATPPTVAMIVPSNGTRYSAPRTVTLLADASDNTGVTKIEFYDGGTLRGTDLSPPYGQEWTFTSADNGLHAWTARAYDAAGNIKTSAVVNLTVEVGLPRLLVRKAGNNLTISWTSSDPSVVLQRTTRLGFNDPWTDVPGAPTVNGNVYTVTLDISVSPLQVRLSGTKLALEWFGNAQLQKADSILGPWTDVFGATSPRTIDPTGSAAFYRLSAQGFYRLSGL
jgi:hypothetical protein